MSQPCFYSHNMKKYGDTSTLFCEFADFQHHFVCKYLIPGFLVCGNQHFSDILF